MASQYSSMEEEHLTDQTPLLSSHHNHGEPEHDETPLNHKKTASLPLVVIYLMAIHFLLAFCELILVAPLLKLFENSLCLSHYSFPPNGITDQELCQIVEVQRPLAKIRGWKSMFDVIPVLLVTIPVGRLGDKYGKKKILALALLGAGGALTEIFVVCAFPKLFSLKLVWFSSIILLCGGGLNSASAYMWAMASEAIPESKRSHGFYYIFSAFYVAEMVASAIASLTTDISPWIPCGLSMGSIVIGLILLAIMPKSPNQINNPSNPEASQPSTQSPTVNSALARVLEAIKNPNICFTIPVFLVGILRYTTLNILIQYAHVRFKLKISTGATFYTETAIVNIILFLFLIPQLTAYIRQEYKIRPQVLDLFLVRTSVSLMCIGALTIGLSPSSKLLPAGVSIFAAGFGSRVSAIALISYWIPSDAKGTIYASITVLECLGHAIADPSMQQIFAASLSMPEFWLAMAFFVAAGCYFLAALSTGFIRVDGGEVE